MKRMKFLFAAIALLVPLSTLLAQPPEMPAEKEHEFLKRFVGEWASETEASMGPGQPAIKGKGTMNARMLGDFWVINDMTGDMGGEMTAVQTIGYDPEKKKYVGTWVDSMMNHMWKYEGTVDQSGKTLTLEAEGPSFADPGKVTKYRDAYEFKSADHIVATSSMQDADGKWIVFMTGQIRRVK